MQEHSVLIIGYGVVGHNLFRELDGHGLLIDAVDKKRPELNSKRRQKYDVAFVCVDTPRVEPGEDGEHGSPCDCGEVVNAIRDNEADLFVIKSTVLPGGTETFKNITGKRIVFSPEYYGGTQHCNNFRFHFTIVGGDRKDCKKLIQVLQGVYDARHRFVMTDSKTAELVKYMENAYLATKVSFCNQFFQIAEQIGVDYEELRELFILDKRVSPSHTFVYRDKPYWDSHCLNKDVRAVAEYLDAPFLKGVIAFNEYCKERAQHKEMIKNAFSGPEWDEIREMAESTSRMQERMKGGAGESEDQGTDEDEARKESDRLYMYSRMFGL